MAEKIFDKNGVVIEKSKPSILKDKRFLTKVGSPIKPVLKRVYDEKSKKYKIVKVDEINIDEYIQAASSSSDLAILKTKILETGEIPQIDQAAHSVDYTLFPHDIHEMFKLKEKAKDTYEGLDAQIREVLTADEFFSAVTTGNFTNLVNTRLAEKAKAEKQKKIEEGGAK